MVAVPIRTAAPASKPTASTELHRRTLCDDQIGTRREDLLGESDLVLAADVQGRALVQLERRDVEDALAAVDRGAAGLLDDERERVRLVEKAQLAARRLGVRRIREDAAAEQVAVEVGHERAD